MKKIALTLLMVAAAALYSPFFVEGASKTLHIKLVDAVMVSNDHVGNEWSYDAQIAGNSVAIGDSIAVKSTAKVKLFATAVEDDKYPDVGSKSLTIKPGTSVGKQFVLNVQVVENRGRYSGNCAVWAFTFEVTP